MIHHFDSGVAVKLGINGAIVIANLAYLQRNREAQGGEKYNMDGRWWVHHTYESLATVHPYFSVDQIRRIMKSLVEQKAVFKCNPDHFKRDCYWSVAPEFLHVAKSPDGSGEIAGSEVAKSPVVLHDNKHRTLYSKRCSRLEDFEINDHLREWANQKQFKGLHAYAETFVNYCLNNPNKYKDYNAACRNWVINGEDRKKNGGKWS